MTSDITDAINQYCARLRKALGKGSSHEADEIVLEVRSHILERIEAEETPTPEALAKILRAVGDPKELAAEYRTQTILHRASRSTSPWLMLRATLRWARKGTLGVIAFFTMVVGYGCTAVFFLSAMLKPFFPSRVGLWLAPEHTLSFGFWNGRLSATEIYGISVRPPVSFVLGTLSPTNGPVRELLGPWLIPVAILCGLLCLFATTFLVRSLIRRFGRQRRDLQFSHSASLA